jgi:hypothetical protein
MTGLFTGTTPRQSDSAAVAGAEPGPGALRLVGALVLILAGVAVAGFYAIGTLFVAGAVQHHEPGVTRVDVMLVLLRALVGVAMVATGVVLLVRRRVGGRS